MLMVTMMLDGVVVVVSHWGCDGVLGVVIDGEEALRVLLVVEIRGDEV